MWRGWLPASHHQTCSHKDVLLCREQHVTLLKRCARDITVRRYQAAPLFRGLSGLRFRAMGGVGHLHGLSGYPRLASGRGARGGEANIRLQQARCSVWRDNHVGTTSTGMKHPPVPRGSLSKRPAANLKKSKKRKRARSTTLSQRATSSVLSPILNMDSVDEAISNVGYDDVYGDVHNDVDVKTPATLQCMCNC